MEVDDPGWVAAKSSRHFRSRTGDRVIRQQYIRDEQIDVVHRLYSQAFEDRSCGLLNHRTRALISRDVAARARRAQQRTAAERHSTLAEKELQPNLVRGQVQSHIDDAYR